MLPGGVMMLSLPRVADVRVPSRTLSLKPVRSMAPDCVPDCGVSKPRTPNVVVLLICAKKAAAVPLNAIPA